ncbi:methylenetetrahydrofolate reductase [Nocardioides panacisoli]|uniref:methylenetetrahydrofolate reductase n=1 Tax=Nocardioides panacisoli TaxID=627624 RepID=UPI001C630C32|nr:methylenetetrahydrofolate reductase [Nocardioides panacisoli]QYJ02917.1 methylenetetrahydrofolate reductase [Nocardioides panacisoli]
MSSRTRPADPEVRRTLRHWLEQPRYEVLPLPGIVDEVAAALPSPTTLTVTASPTHGTAATLEVAEHLSAQGHRVVPHLAARLLHDEAELAEVVDRLTRHGIGDAFVVAGDAPEPAGSFEGALEVVTALSRLAPHLRVGVAGYPETHPRIPDDVASRALWDKRDHAAYVVTQVCFDAHVVRAWVAGLRIRGIGLPVLLGLPGPVPTTRLLRVGQRIGVGASLRFLTGNAGMLRVLRPGAFDPLPLLGDVAEPGGDLVAGVHLYTFNAVADTEQWRLGVLADLAEDAA